MKDYSFSKALWTTGQKYYYNNIVPRGRCKSRNRRIVSGYKRKRSQYNAILQKSYETSSMQRVGGVNNRVLARLEHEFYMIDMRDVFLKKEFIKNLVKGSLRRYFTSKMAKI